MRMDTCTGLLARRTVPDSGSATVFFHSRQTEIAALRFHGVLGLLWQPVQLFCHYCALHIQKHSQKRMKVPLFRRCGPSTSPALQRCATCRYCSLEESRSNYTDCTPALYWTSWILATSIFKRLLRNSDANQGTAVEEGDGVDLIFCFSIPRRKTRPRRLQLPPSSTCALDICDSFLLSPVPGAIR